MPAPVDFATALYHAALDPFTKKPVHIAKSMRDRKMQRALLQFFKPDNWFTVREALIEAGRQDLIGNGCDCLIPDQPPQEALDARRRHANSQLQGDHYHTVANPSKGERPGERGLNRGYRPERKTQKRRQEKHKLGAYPDQMIHPCRTS